MKLPSSHLRDVLAVVSLITACFLLPARAGQPWVEKHDVNSSQLQQAFNTYTQSPYGLGQTTESAAYVSGEARYASLWGPPPSGAWYSRTSLTAGELDTWNNQYTSQGLHITSLDVYNHGGQERFNVIWTAAANTTSHLVKSQNFNQITSQNVTEAAAGYSLTEIDAENTSGTVLFTAVWKKLSVAGPPFPVIRFNYNDADLLTEISTQAAAGRQMTALKGWEDTGAARWMARFETGQDANRWFFYGVGKSRHETEILNSFYQGYRPAYVNVFKMGSTPVYSAIYVRNGGYPADRLRAFNNAVSQFIQTQNMAGLSIALMQGEKLVYAKGFGQADKASALYMHPEHRFRIASVSKVVTALAAVVLSESINYFGVDLRPFALDRTLVGSEDSYFGRTLPGNPAFVLSNCHKLMSLRHLLNHTTGWWRGANTGPPAPQYSTSNFCPDIDSPQANASLSVDGVVKDQLYENSQLGVMTAAFSTRQQIFIPGMEFNYTNANYALIARTIEQFTGMDFETAVTNLVLKPSGVKAMNIGWQQQAKRLPNEVTYYDSNSGTDPYLHYDVRAGDGAGGWVAAPKDLLLIARRMDLLSGKTDIISASALNSTMRAWLPPSDAGGYGMGWALNSNRNLEGHSGGGPGVASFLARFTAGSPLEGFKLAFVANEGQNFTDSTKGAGAFTILDTLIPLLAAHFTSAAEIPAQDLLWQENDTYDNLRLSRVGLSSASLSSADIGILPQLIAPDLDQDRDGMPALIEDYFGTSDSLPQTRPVISVDSGARFSLLRWQAGRNTGIQAVMEASADMQNWIPLPSTAIIPDPTQGGVTTDAYRFQVPESASTVFYRLRVSPR